jgi:hypothetical protein
MILFSTLNYCTISRDMIFYDFSALVFSSAGSAFIDVTVFVGLALFIFGFIDFKQGGGFVKAIENKSWCKSRYVKKPWCQPIIGALLGLTPGCGGAILVMPLFVKKQVTFGTVIATLIATSGDAAFVLISEVPLTFLYVSSVTFLVSVLAGILVDKFKIGVRLNLQKESLKGEARHGVRCGCSVDSSCFKHAGHEADDKICEILHRGVTPHRHVWFSYLFYLVFLFAGLIFGVLNLFNFNYGDGFFSSAIFYLGALGTVLSISFMIVGKKFFSDDTYDEVEAKRASFKEMIVHNVGEVAFVGTWVFFGYLAYEIFVFALGGGNYFVGEEMLFKFMSFVGIWAVLVASLVGMIPGCGPQVILVTLFTKGLFPFAALLAHTISQDGDALFPLIALNKKAALWATVITTLVALFVGTVWFFLF